MMRRWRHPVSRKDNRRSFRAFEGFHRFQTEVLELAHHSFVVDERAEDRSASSIGGEPPRLQVCDAYPSAKAELCRSFHPHSNLRRVLSVEL
jgi:hypothetical protein